LNPPTNAFPEPLLKSQKSPMNQWGEGGGVPVF